MPDAITSKKLGAILAVLTVAATIAAAYFSYATLIRPTADPEFALTRSWNDPCLLDQFVRDFPRDASHAQQARNRMDALGGCSIAPELDQLGVEMRLAVVAARHAKQRALEATVRSREIADRAEDAAAAARLGSAGSIIVACGDGCLFEGDAEGYGVMTRNGARTASHWANPPFGASLHGGVYYYPTDTPFGSFAYVDEGNVGGLGVFNRGDGITFIGQYEVGPIWSGYGVRVAPSGRYEGQWADNKENGLGVLWDPHGDIIRQGIWRNGQLVGAPAARSN